MIINILRKLFKDEVRILGKNIDLPDYLINRHSFPIPGLANKVV